MHTDELVITQIHMGFVSVIEGIDVVVLGSGVIAFFLKQCADGVERLLLRIGIHLTIHGQT